MAYFLEGQAEGYRGPLPLHTGIQRVGRSHGNDLRLEDPSVSREHAEISVAETEVRVSDLGSKNGTWVEGTRISQPTRLKPGSPVRFGRLDFILRSTTEPSAAAPATSGLVSTIEGAPGEMRVGAGSTFASLAISTQIDPKHFKAIADAANLVVRPRSPQETIERLMDCIAQVVRARRIFLLRNERSSPPMPDSGLEDEPGESGVTQRLSLVAARPMLGGTADTPVLSRSILRLALRERTTLLLTDPTTDARFSNQQSIASLGIHSAMVAPLFQDEELLGLLYAYTDSPYYKYDHHDLTLFTLLGNLTAAAVTHARLQEVQREGERMRQELMVAAQVQRSLLSTDMPEVAGYEIVARQIPCYEVGGDLYDITRLRDGRIAIAVGDVTGKGLGAALLMSNVIASMRALYEHFTNPAVLMGQIHRNLLRSSDGRRFVTLFLGLLDPERHRLEYVNAGHCPPLLIGESRIPRALEVTGMPAGLFEGASYEVRAIELPPEALFCCVSDGITEAQSGDALFEDHRLLESIRRRFSEPLDQIAEGLVQDLRSFIGEESLADDATMLLMRRGG